jgi:hypothetical protein
MICAGSEGHIIHHGLECNAPRSSPRNSTWGNSSAISSTLKIVISGSMIYGQCIAFDNLKGFENDIPTTSAGAQIDNFVFIRFVIK